MPSNLHSCLGIFEITVIDSRVCRNPWSMQGDIVHSKIEFHPEEKNDHCSSAVSFIFIFFGCLFHFFHVSKVVLTLTHQVVNTPLRQYKMVLLIDEYMTYGSIQ